jgi:hypothetical protein
MIIHSNKIQEGMTFTEENGEFTLTRNVNITPLLQANYESRKDPQNGFSKDKNWRRVISVSVETIMQWMREYPEIMSGDHEAEDRALKKLLKREENKGFSTVENIKGIF